MDFFKNVGSMVGKGFDSIKTQINAQMYKTQDSTESPQPSLPKGVHILGVDDQSNPQQNISNTNNSTNSDNLTSNDYNKINPKSTTNSRAK